MQSLANESPVLLLLHQKIEYYQQPCAPFPNHNFFPTS